MGMTQSKFRGIAYSMGSEIGNELEVYSIHVNVYLRGSVLVNK
jgi:hypothetical protein